MNVIIGNKKIITINMVNFLYFSFILFIFIPYSRNDLRIGGIPLAYIPLILVFVYVMYWNIRKKRKILLNKFILFTSILFFMYITLNIFWVKIIESWFIRYIMFFVYIFGFIYFINYVKLQKVKIETFLFKYIDLLAILSFFAILKLPLILLFVPTGFNITDIGANVFSFMNKNLSIFVTVPFISLSLIKYYMYPNKKNLLGFFLIFIGSLLVFSRSGIVGSLFSLFMTILFFFKFPRFKKIHFKFILLLLIIIFIILIFLGKFLLTKITMIMDIFNIVTGNIQEGRADYHRSLIVKAAKYIFEQNPILGSGIGLKNYIYYYPKGIFEEDDEYLYTVAHNFYYTYSAMLGVVGFSILLLFLFSLMFYYINNIISARTNKKLKLYSYGFLIGHISILLMFVGNEYITSPFPWFFWALSISVIKHIKCINYKKVISNDYN